MAAFQQTTDFHSIISELQAEIHSLQQRSALQLRPKPSLPDPERFTGQSHKFDTWLPSIKAKLRVDGPAIGDSIAQFYYVYLNLDSHVQAMVLPKLGHAEEAQQWDYITILDQLTRVYDNPNKVQEAEDKLYQLRQATDSLPAYIAKFERVLYEARGQNWPHVNKISTFRNGLNSTLRTRLSQQLNLPHTYSEFVRIVQQLSGRSSHSGGGSGSGGSFPAPRPTPASDPMDITAINAISPAIGHTGANQARSISPAIRQQYRQTGKCVRCGSGDHWVNACPQRPFSTGLVNTKIPRTYHRDWDDSASDFSEGFD